MRAIRNAAGGRMGTLRFQMGDEAQVEALGGCLPGEALGPGPRSRGLGGGWTHTSRP